MTTENYNNSNSSSFKLGSTILGELFGGAVPTCTLFGLYICALAISIYICAENGIHGRPQKILWACMTLLSLCNVWHYGIQIKFALLAASSLSDHHIQVEKPLTQVCTVPLNINLVVGDAIVAWRTCNIWTKPKILRYLLAMLMAGNIVANIVDVVIDAVTDAANREITMDYVATSFSFAVNLLCTSLIFLKAWSYFQNFRVRPLDAGQSHSYTDLKRILTLLIESGIIFCSIQLISILVQIFTYHQETYALRIWNLALGMTRNAAAVLYPLAVFLIVNLNLSSLNDKCSVFESTFTTVIPSESRGSLAS
ncbi:hypothetical protein DFH05DRAFT_1006065 [Lentinula detonsa]|uniref:Uncharacterized protein n=1 Tax=Lentinula detonsa TaxID=2804962 RepID=A0A9W8TY98_9AGAR|nr:hypothetical protein DFH05DRAFT_1006065 [Lentinula detonsa]